MYEHGFHDTLAANVKNEDSFEDFFKMFRINSDEDEIKDCIRDLIDNTDVVNEDSNDDKGEFIIKMKRLRHKSIEEVLLRCFYV